MKNSALFVFMPLIAFSLASCGGSARPKQTIDSKTKGVFASCKQKVDVVKDSLSELTMEESGEYDDGPSQQPLLRKDASYSGLGKTEYLTLQNFGLYILNDVYHSLTYGYDSEGVALNQLIYDETQNELNGDYRTYLKGNNKTNKFYMQVANTEAGYSFKVDWLGDNNFRGNIYVNGAVGLTDGEVTDFTVTSFTEDKSCYIYAAHYDFLNNDFYQFNTSHNDPEYLGATKDLIGKLNRHEITVSDIESSHFDSVSVAKGKITKNIGEINYVGYRRDIYNAGEEKEAFDIAFDSLKDKVSKVEVRTSDDALDYSASKRVHFMDAALQFGLDVTKLYVTSAGSAVFHYTQKQVLIDACDNVPSDFRELFAKAKAKLTSAGNKGDSVEYQDDELVIEVDVRNPKYYSLNTYWADQVYYSMFDLIKDETVYFSIKGSSVVNIRTSNTDYVPSDDPNYEVTVKVMTGFGNAANHQIQTTIIDPFNEEYKGKYKVELEKGGSASDIITRVRMMAEGGIAEDIPDAIITKADLLESLVANDACRKYLYNFDSFFEKSGLGFGEEECARFDQAMLNDGTNYSIEGRWGLPFDASDQYMFYDKALFEGETKRYELPTTFDELVAVARQIKQDRPEQDYYPVAFTGTKFLFVNAFLQNDIPFLTNKEDPFEYKNSEYREKEIELLSAFQSYFQDGLFSSKDINGQYVNQLFNANSCAIGFMQQDAVRNLNNQDGIGVAKVPFANNKQIYSRPACVSSVSLFKNADPYSTRGAWLFIKKLLMEHCADYSLGANYNPCIKYNTEDIKVNGLSRDLAILNNEVRGSYRNIVKVEKIEDVYNQLDQVFSQFNKGSSPEAVLDRLLDAA